jgi:PAS domain-containing protein
MRYVNVNPLDLLETIREGILVLEPDLTIRFANRSFCHTFAVAPEHTVGRKLYEIGTDSGTFPSSAPRSRPSFLTEKPSRPLKLSISSHQSAGA